MGNVIRFNCPQCQAKIAIGESHLGDRVKCPQCGIPFDLSPSPTPEQSQPAAEGLDFDPDDLLNLARQDVQEQEFFSTSRTPTVRAAQPSSCAGTKVVPPSNQSSITLRTGCGWLLAGTFVVILFALCLVPGLQEQNVGRFVDDPPSQEDTFQEAFFPGLTAESVYGFFSREGFGLDTEPGPEQTIWRCNKETADQQMLVEIFGASPMQITLVRATFMNSTNQNTDRAAREFLKSAAGIRYSGSLPARARDWVGSNLGKTKSTTIGNVTFEIRNVSQHVRMLLMLPVQD